MTLNIEFGAGLAAKTLNGLARYVVATQKEPWAILEPQLTSTPTSVIVNHMMELSHVEKLAVIDLDVEYVVGFGGGVASDTAKFLAWKWGCKLIQIPSIISTDAFMSQEVGIREGSRVRYIGKAQAERIIIDYDIIRAAPAHLNYAGVCDVLSITTALGDWVIARDQFGRPFDQAVHDGAKQIAQTLMDQASLVHELSDEGIRALVDALAAEIVLCEGWGNARPEEGGEHFLAYCVENTSPRQYVHGSLVGLNIIVVLRLQGDRAAFDWRAVQQVLDVMGVQYRPSDIGITRDVYKAALHRVQEYVREENLDYGLWSLDDPFEALSVEEVLDWVFGL